MSATNGPGNSKDKGRVLRGVSDGGSAQAKLGRICDPVLSLGYQGLYRGQQEDDLCALTRDQSQIVLAKGGLLRGFVLLDYLDCPDPVRSLR